MNAKEIKNRGREQVITKQTTINYDGQRCLLIAEIRYGDDCNNNHNDFAITGEIWELTRSGAKKGIDCIACGCIHEEIEGAFPGLKSLIEWRLTSQDGPMYYYANTEYHKRNGDLKGVLSCSCFGKVPELDTMSTTELMEMDEKDFREWLESRLPQLIKTFKKDMERLGFDFFLNGLGKVRPTREGRFKNGNFKLEACKCSQPIPPSREELKEAANLKKREDIKADYDKAIKNANNEFEGFTWLLDRNLSTNDCIYYSHTGRFGFGLKKTIRENDRENWVEVLKDFPFEYKIETV